MAFYLYFLKCSDDSLYTGHTDDLNLRLAQHHTGTFKSCYSFSRRPIQLLKALDFPTRQEALGAERMVKKWSRAKKWAFILEDGSQFHELSKSSEQRKRESRLREDA
jgi:predicted GIY-YIG superfamily endonuclease